MKILRHNAYALAGARKPAKPRAIDKARSQKQSQGLIDLPDNHRLKRILGVDIQKLARLSWMPNFIPRRKGDRV